MTMRVIIAAAFLAAITGLVPLPATANKDGYYRHCHAAHEHQHNEGKFHFCINSGSIDCRADCDRVFIESSAYRACAIECNNYSEAHRNQESWRQ